MTNRRRLVGGGEPSLVSRARGWSGLAVLLALGACRGDTLYDVPRNVQATNVPPPTVTLLAPAAGLQVQAGRTVRVSASATDTLGITVLQLRYSGVASGTVERSFNPPRTVATLDTAIAVPAGAAGQLQLTVTARNTGGAEASTAARSVIVSPIDATAPTISMTAAVPARMEATDSVRVNVTAADETGSGVVRIGATALALVGGQTVALSATPRTFSPAAPGPVTADLTISSAGHVLPPGTTVRVYAFAVDSAGNCAAATVAESSLPCSRVAVGADTVIVAASGTAVPAPITTVAGRTTPLPGGAVIADLVPDAARKLVYLSNLPGNRIEVLNLTTGALGTPVLAGSQPWGIAFNRTSDTLIVANSGGTNISYLPLTPTGPSGEALQQRLRTQNADMYKVTYQLRDTVLPTGVRDTIFVVDIELTHFSDRPQFIAQDQNGRLLYSTLPTKAAGAGTIRVVSGGDSRLAVQVLPTSPETLLPTFEPDTLALINIDSMRAGNCLHIYDHVPGNDANVIQGDACTSLAQGLTALQAQGSDAAFFDWNTQLLSFGDTSFVAASGDHHFIAFAEGAKNPGHIVIWNGATGTISNGVTLTDLVDNTAEHLVALGLNSNGSIGVARGIDGAYYFTNDLRLQGSRSLPVVGAAGAGAVLDPQNPGYGPIGTVPPYNGWPQLSYVATANGSIKIFDTVNFAERGEIAIRDNIIGPLRVSGPVVSGALATLYGATDGGGVVVVNVFPTDIHP